MLARSNREPTESTYEDEVNKFALCKIRQKLNVLIPTKGCIYPLIILARADVRLVGEEIDSYSTSCVSSGLHEEPVRNQCLGSTEV